MKASGCDLAEIGTRMKAARAVLGLSQDGLAKAVGGSKRGIQGNEANNRVPGGEVICGLIDLGINANWLLTGEGPMLLSELQAPSSPPGALDPARLRLAIETVEEGLSVTRRTMTPDRKAELVTAVYDLFDEDVSDKARDRVLRLVKSAA